MQDGWTTRLYDQAMRAYSLKVQSILFKFDNNLYVIPGSLNIKRNCMFGFFFHIKLKMETHLFVDLSLKQK